MKTYDTIVINWENSPHGLFYWGFFAEPELPQQHENRQYTTRVTKFKQGSIYSTYLTASIDKISASTSAVTNH